MILLHPESDKGKIKKGNTVQHEIFMNLQDILPSDMLDGKKKKILFLFDRDSLEQLNAGTIVDTFLHEYEKLRRYMIYEDIKNNQPLLFKTIWFNNEEEFDFRFRSQKKMIGYLIDAIQPFVKEDLSFFDTLVEKDEIQGMKELYNIETIRERLINNDKLTDEEKTIILWYLTFRKTTQ